MEITNGTQFFKDSGVPNRNGKIVVFLDDDGRPEEYLSVSAPGEVQSNVHMDTFWTYSDIPADGQEYLCAYRLVLFQKPIGDQILYSLFSIMPHDTWAYYDGNNYHDRDVIEIIAHCKKLPELKNVN